MKDREHDNVGMTLVQGAELCAQLNRYGIRATGATSDLLLIQNLHHQYGQYALRYDQAQCKWELLWIPRGLSH